MTKLLSLTLFPFFVGDSSHDFHRFLLLLLLFFHLALVVILDLLMASVPLLLDQTVFQPVFERTVPLLLLDLFLQALLLLLSQLLLLLQSLRDKLALLPLEHSMRPLLVLFVEGGLLNDHLLEQVFLGLEHKHFAKTLLMFFDSQPVLVVDLSLGHVLLLLNVHVKDALVDNAKLRLLNIIFELHMRLHATLLVSKVLHALRIQVLLGSLVQTFQQALVLQILPLLGVQISFILLNVVALVVRLVLASVFRLFAIGQVAIVLVSLLQLTLLFKVDDFRVVYTDGTAKRLGPHHLIDEVHGLRWQLDALDSLFLAQVGVNESDRVRVLVVECAGRHHVEVASLLDSFDLVLLGFGAHRDDLFIFEPGSSHSALILLLLKSPHDLVLFDSAEVVLVGDARVRVDPRLRDRLGLPNPVKVRSGPRALLLTDIAVSFLG